MNHLEKVRKCVVFVAAKKHDGEMVYLGSAFFLATLDESLAEENNDEFYAVTALHVIELAKNKLSVEEIYLRLNGYDEPFWAPIPISAWSSHPNDKSIDVAVVRVKLPPKLDHMVVGRSALVTEELLAKQEVGLGDEVFIVGLYRHHKGKLKNIPIVRVGNLACMSEEKIATDTQFGAIDAYLIEARSIGGLSGSPVFVNLNRPRTIGGITQLTGSGVYLLGLIHGHVDVKGHTVDADTEPPADAKPAPSHVNTGIAIVVPTVKLVSTVSEYEQHKPPPPAVQIVAPPWPEDKVTL